MKTALIRALVLVAILVSPAFADPPQPPLAPPLTDRPSSAVAPAPADRPSPIAVPEPNPSMEIVTDFLTGRAIIMRDPAYTGGYAVGAPAPYLVGRAALDFDTARDIADAFVAGQAAAFGPSRPAEVLAAYVAETDELGLAHVRYHQFHNGVPIFAAELIVHVDADGRVTAAGGHLAPDLTLGTTPLLTAVEAIERAEQHWTATYALGVEAADPAPTLYVLVPDVLGLSDDARSAEGLSLSTSAIPARRERYAAYLVWQVRLRVPGDAPPIDEMYYIDAASGDVRLTLDNIRRLNRKVYDCSSKPGTDLCSCDILVHYDAYSPAWTPPPTDYPFGVKDVGATYPWPHGPNPRYLPETSTDTDDLFVLLADVHNYYQTKFGRNGANGQGGNTNGTVFPLDMDAGRTYMNWISGWGVDCLDAACASNRGVMFCKDLVIYDVVGHEYAHALSFSESWGLSYSGQTGALNESYSDLAGEIFQYWMTGANDWIVGGTVVTFWNRNLADPPSVYNPICGLSYPDRFFSSNVYCGSLDNGGVHHNSTIPSKALYLASMGGEFNGCTIGAIGREKVEQILYRANTQYYTSSESFSTAYYHLIQACADLYGANSDDCWQLTKALRAVELDQPGYCSGLPGWTPICGPFGDLNCDHTLDGADIPHFVQALLSPAGYAADHDGSPYPMCSAALADVNRDGSINLADIGPFVNLLLGE